MHIQQAITHYLTELTQANRSLHTRRAYQTDLQQFAIWYDAPVEDVTVGALRDFFVTVMELSAATRARKQAVLASFLGWAYRQEMIAANPMGRVERVKHEPSAPRGVGREQVERILAVIPTKQTRDRLLFRLLLETGLRIGEALTLHIEDIDLIPDDEHLRVLGKGNKRRTVLLDDPRLVRQLRRFLKQTQYKHGALFRAQKNGRGGALRYQSVQERWAHYCAQTGVTCTLHQLRHTHATELLNDGVSLATIRKRLGHKHLQTTLRYAEQSDPTADEEIRRWRRQHALRHYP